MLVKSKGRLIYLLSKNRQIRLSHIKLSHVSNIRAVKAFKLKDGVNIPVKDANQTVAYLFSNSKSDKDDILEEPDTTYLIPMINLNRITNLIDDIKDLYNLCIESKHSKVVRHKKMTPITLKFLQIHPNLWKPHNLLLLSGKIYV